MTDISFDCVAMGTRSPQNSKKSFSEIVKALMSG